MRMFATRWTTRLEAAPVTRRRPQPKDVFYAKAQRSKQQVDDCFFAPLRETLSEILAMQRDCLIRRPSSWDIRLPLITGEAQDYKCGNAY